MAKRKMIIDCDAGIDDAQAILIALSAPDVEVVAITCVAGNATIENVCVNVLKVLELCDRRDIPVFKGATGSLLGEELYAIHRLGVELRYVTLPFQSLDPMSK